MLFEWKEKNEAPWLILKIDAKSSFASLCPNRILFW